MSNGSQCIPVGWGGIMPLLNMVRAIGMMLNMVRVRHDENGG